MGRAAPEQELPKSSSPHLGQIVPSLSRSQKATCCAGERGEEYVAAFQETESLASKRWAGATTAAGSTTALPTAALPTAVSPSPAG